VNVKILEVVVALASSLYGSQSASVPPPPLPASPQAAIRVELLSGRVFSGDVDSQTDGSELVLRTPMLGGFIARPIQWDRVVRAEVVGETVSGEQLRQIVEAIRHTHPRPAPPGARLALD
jgi:hypothetical protein